MKNKSNTMKYSILFALIFIFTSCKNFQKSKMEPLEDIVVSDDTQSDKPHPGKRIMEQECYICHDPKASVADRIAPPMEAIKRHYIDTNTTKVEFTEALIKWVNDPETKTKMPGAHAKFGPMPYIPKPLDAIEQIADYVYDYEIERPNGFDSQFPKAHKKGMGMGACNCFTVQEPEKEYAAIGLAYAMEAKFVLGKNLKRAIQEHGTIGAIAFCHTEATILTDSVSMMNNAIIKRVSDKPRNANNQANKMELNHLVAFKELAASGKDIEPIVHKENGDVNFYYPITTNTLCLQCHGKPEEEIQPATMAKLLELYPADKAIGYSENEIRGIWAITFDEQTAE